MTDGSLNALSALRLADIRPGQTVLVYGASGAIGTAGVQLAKNFGAEVTAASGTRNIELVRSLGADRVLDYRQEDVTATRRRYDVVFDAVGRLSFGRCRRSLKSTGCYLPTDGLLNVPLALLTRCSAGPRVLFEIPPRRSRDDIVLSKQLVEAGRYRVVVDRTYTLQNVVEATRYVETRRKTGNVVVTIDPPGAAH